MTYSEANFEGERGLGLSLGTSLGFGTESTTITRSSASQGAAGASSASRGLASVRASASQGAAGASSASRTRGTLRTSASQGAAGQSSASRTVALERTSVAGNGGTSASSRVAAYVRASASEGVAGDSTASRSLASVRVSASEGATGTSAARRLLDMGRTAASQGAIGTSSASREATVDRLFFIDGERVAPSAESVAVGPETITFGGTREAGLPAAIEKLERTDDPAVESGFAGRFRALPDRDDAAVTVDAPLVLNPAVVDGDRIPVGFGREEVAPDTQEIEIELQRPTNRDRALAAGDVVDTSGAWEIDLARGRLGLDREQVGQIEAEGSTAEAVAELALRLSDRETATLIEAANSPAAVVERSVPNGPDRLVDSTPDDRQTATLSVPSEVQLDGGEWLVAEWDCELTNRESEPWDVSVTLRRSGEVS